ncbi:hypothetical protein [Bergeyella sp. RCAD1439]|uniref:hypothetical protein n=1 Tax=Bergeyella anatis TaxID=3113737 RepID=UPI002E19BDE7|nr:hypothetical protein [Bergeyella sp. RCAD1439]
MKKMITAVALTLGLALGSAQQAQPKPQKAAKETVAKDKNKAAESKTPQLPKEKSSARPPLKPQAEQS